jgi:glycine cleavage system H protein
MNIEKSACKDLYYTKDHEWIEFQGSVAYVGICSFKLIGFREVQQLIFNCESGPKKQGEVIAIIKYKDYQIELHMPVDGKILKTNQDFLMANPNILLQHAETSGWMLLIIPTQPYARKDLLLPKHYLMTKRHYNHKI